MRKRKMDAKVCQYISVDARSCLGRRLFHQDLLSNRNGQGWKWRHCYPMSGDMIYTWRKGTPPNRAWLFYFNAGNQFCISKNMNCKPGGGSRTAHISCYRIWKKMNGRDKQMERKDQERRAQLQRRKIKAKVTVNRPNQQPSDWEKNLH